MAEINKEDIFGTDLSAPLQELQGTLEDVLGTLDSLRKSGKGMETSFKEAGTVTKETNQETKKLVDNLNTLDKTEKKLEESIKKQTKAQKDSGAAVKNSTDALDKLAPAQSSAIKGFQGMIQGAKAFIATPIGAIIAALAIVVGVLIKAFQKFEPVIDFFENIITQASAAVNSFLDNIKLVGDILGNVLTGQFSKAWDGTKQLAGAMGDAADEAQRLLDVTRDLEDAELRYRVESASAANQIKAWVTAAKNRNNTIEETEALLKKASDLENEMTAQAVANANKRFEIEKGLLVASKRSQLVEKGLQEQRLMSNKEYIDALIDSGVFSPEQLEPLISAYEKVEQEASAGLALQEKIQNSLDAAEAKNAAAAEKRAALREKELAQLEKLSAAIDTRTAKGVTMEEKLEASAVKRAEKDAELENTKVIAQMKQINLTKEYDKTRLESDAVSRVIQKQRDEELGTLGLLSASFGTLSKTLKQGTMAQKAFASANAVINTFLGATMALSDPAYIGRPIARFLAVGTIIASGIASLGKINNVPIPGFFKGVGSAPKGLAFVGERGSELMNVPGQGLVLSPNTATLTNLKRGTEIIPHEKSMAMLAGSGVDVGNSKGFTMLNHLQLVNDSVKQIGNQIVGAVDRSSSKLVTQGTEIYELKRMSDTKRKLIRSKSFSS